MSPKYLFYHDDRKSSSLIAEKLAIKDHRVYTVMQ